MELTSVASRYYFLNLPLKGIYINFKTKNKFCWKPKAFKAGLKLLFIGAINFIELLHFLPKLNKS